MTVVAQNCRATHEIYRRSLVGLEMDDRQTQMLLSITRRHCKLGVEHGGPDTTPEQRREIIEEIQSLRTLRDDLIAEWRASSENNNEL